MTFLNTSSWRKIHSIIVKKWPPKGVFDDLLEKYLGMNVGLWSSVCVCVSGLEKFFMIIFVMFVNEEVCEIVFTISSCTDYEFSAAILIFKVLM